MGYTNAGKSTLMNALTGAGVLAEDKLFSTLDTRTRQWRLSDWGRVLLSDTVGFIRELPHHLGRVVQSDAGGNAASAAAVARCRRQQPHG